jgi:hypothetical protein
MARRGKIYDVLVSHSPKDSALALEVADACRASGLESVVDSEILSRDDGGDSLWEALVEIGALIVILSPSGLTSPMVFEVGAVQSWNKPIFAVVTDPVSTRLPPALRGTDLYTIGRIQDVINAIKRNAEQITDEDREFLGKQYAVMAISLDQLTDDSDRLEDLVKSIRKGRGKTVSGERLLSELFRLRKQGRLRRRRTLPSTPSA